MSITINGNIPGLAHNSLVLIKTIIYEKSQVRENKTYKRYLTLFAFVPEKEYKAKVETLPFKDGTSHPINTQGVYVKVIGSMEGIFPVHNRVNLTNYQKMIVSAGWTFKATVPGVKGMDFEVARKLAFGVIQKFQKDKKDENLSLTLCPEIKNIMLERIDDAYTLSEKGESCEFPLRELTSIIQDINAVDFNFVKAILDEIDQIVFDNQCGAKSPSCVDCGDENCVYNQISNRIKYLKSMFNMDMNR